MHRAVPRSRDLIVPVLVLGLVVQLVIAQFREPYPALMMPGFGGVPGATGEVTVQRYVISGTADGGRVFVDDGERILADLPVHYRSYTLDHLIARHESSDPAVAAWLAQRVSQLTGDSGWASFEIQRRTMAVRP